MKRGGWLVLFCIQLCVSATQPEPPRVDVAVWEEPKASYRLECEAFPDSEHSSIDLSRLALPGGLYDRFTVFGGGKKLEGELDEHHILHVKHRKNLPEFRVYFGLGDEGGITAGKRANGTFPYLRMRVVSGYVTLTPEDYRTRRIDQINRSMTNRYMYQNRASGRLFFELTTAPGIFIHYRNEAWLLNARQNAAKELREQYIRSISNAARPRRKHGLFPNFHHNVNFRLDCFQRRYLRDRLIWQLPAVKNNPDQWRKQLNQVEAEYKMAPRTELKRLLARRNLRIHADVPVRRLELDKRPFDTGGGFVVESSGLLAVTQPEEEIEFAFRINSTSFLEIDGAIVWERYGEKPPAPGYGDLFKIKLKRGIHPFKFFYLKRGVSTTLSVSIRRGGKDFETISQDDFAPGGAPATAVGLRSRSGDRYPVVTVNDDYALVAGKTERIGLDCYRVSRPDRLRFDWVLNHRRYPGATTSYIARRPGDVLKLVVTGDRELCRDLEIVTLGTPAEKLPAYPAIALENRIPRLLYDDEKLTSELVQLVRLPFRAQLYYTLRLPGRELKTLGPDFGVGSGHDVFRFHHGDRFTQRVSLDARVLPHQELVATLGFIGYEAARVTVRFEPVRSMEPAPLRDFGAKDEVVVPILRRPDLSMLREWELPRRASALVKPVRRIVVMSSDPSLLQALEATVTGAKGTFSGVDLSEGLPGNFARMLSQPASTESSAVFIATPPAQLRGPLADWENIRILGGVLERLRETSNVRTIYLCLPEEVRETNLSRQFAEELRKMARSYGISLLPGGIDALREQIFTELNLPKR